MRASWYAKALYGVTTEGALSEADAVERFLGTVSANGHTHMLRKILRAYERLLATHAKREIIEVTTATELSQAEVAQLLRKEPFSNILSSKHKRVLRRIDPAIIGGAVARTSASRVDQSHKNMLVQIYQNMTNHL